ncbi:MAG: MFS transporter [Flavobacteriaceae bacterium CG_4_10_14_3_um_filter_31_253]|nr:MAG: MFS transporter [Flavobacteriaceae bacterium CG2_30_31_66]PIV96515.1 MAG: MFS transporter [Flavobacteriaceae bacterium CG17_big_fil_post_rev_8_21_14_2_50_31_13]PIX12408.1 MAG: MFS transporter [Flavobacteriaceae bacterium CG_4_8_14_3_um_filter_31_8]PIY16037.1 MAG: MFS transporter [Flavobacteriaceae bacterium CG_4_10_14_3_um_filter_31_253]PIZ09886.1 MAG: MFS transporter [Flavobacteriaceae bacterium CG_4_10_14_0_8_um_filter_31_99]PJC09332.1 MAG: MFS transporter [Flavobacteriaceae bacteriu
MTATNTAIGKYRWTICGLLFFATTVNYLDRQVLSLLAPSLSEEFGWSNTDYANITAVFQFVYAISMIFAGRIIDKLGTKKGFILAITIWSLGAIMHAYSLPIGTAFSTFMVWVGLGAVPISIAGFMISRVVLGFGESGNFPAAIKAVAEYFPKKERSLATGIFNSGSNVGAILAPLTVPVIAEFYGWEFAFILIGAIGFLWIIFWYIFYETPSKQKRLSKAEFDYIHQDSEEVIEIIEEKTEKVAWIKLLGYKQTWAFVFGKFMTDGIWWFFLFWLPKYLEAQFGMKGTDIVLPLAVLYSMTMFGSIGGGWFPMYYINKGYNPYVGRMKAMFVIALFPLVVLLAQPLGYISFWIPVLLIGVGASAHQAWSANIFTTVSDMFPKKAVASIIGIGGMAGGIGGVLVSKLGGYIFDYYDGLGHIQTGYTIMFVLCAVAYLIAWFVMKLLVPKYNPIKDL